MAREEIIGRRLLVSVVCGWEGGEGGGLLSNTQNLRIGNTALHKERDKKKQTYRKGYKDVEEHHEQKNVKFKQRGKRAAE